MMKMNIYMKNGIWILIRNINAFSSNLEYTVLRKYSEMEKWNGAWLLKPLTILKLLTTNSTSY